MAETRQPSTLYVDEETNVLLEEYIAKMAVRPSKSAVAKAAIFAFCGGRK